MLKLAVGMLIRRAFREQGLNCVWRAADMPGLVLFPMGRASNRRMSLKVVSSREAAAKPGSNPCLAWTNFTDTWYLSTTSFPKTHRPTPLLSQTLRRQGLGRVLAQYESHIVRTVGRWAASG